MLPGPEKALDDAKSDLGKLEANCFGKVRGQVAAMTAAQSFVEASEARDRAQDALQHVRAKPGRL